MFLKDLLEIETVSQCLSVDNDDGDNGKDVEAHNDDCVDGINDVTEIVIGEGAVVEDHDDEDET